MKVTGEYIWIDGNKPVKTLRSKTKVLDLHGSFGDRCEEQGSHILELWPRWTFDGSSTRQATGHDSDCILEPVRVVRDPLSSDPHSSLILCEVLNPDLTMHATNTRADLRAACDEIASHFGHGQPMAGFEQEYTLFRNHQPLGWPIDPHGRRAQPPAQGPYYCGVGADEAYGRELSRAHLEACIAAGLSICGTNGEVMPGQWEFQIGPTSSRGRSDGDSYPGEVVEMSDHLWIARWLLYRLGEKYGITVTLDCKPMKGDWNGAGMHTNFSTDAMRNKAERKLTTADGKSWEIPCGMAAIEAAAERLKAVHKEHIAVYGDGLEDRLTGHHETCDINTFRWGVADRGASVRIPRHVAIDGVGYLEDRRPGANADPYQVAAALVRTICSPPEGYQYLDLDLQHRT